MIAEVLQPLTLSKNLFPHQLRAISLLEERERNQLISADNFCIHTNVGIFADMAGYGKTITLVTLILRNSMKWDLKEPYIVSNISNIYGNGTITKKSLLRFQKINTSLIVANISILKQWSEEISHTPLSYVIVNSRKKLDILEPTLYDIVLCSPSLYNYLVNKFPNYAWKRFISDEPLQTKIPAMRCIVSGFIWFITATPTQLLYQNHNHHNFLQSIFSNCMDFHIFQNLIIKNPDDFVKQSFTLPTIHHHYHQCHQPLYNVVRNIISDSISNMIDAGNIEKAIKYLGGSSGSNIFTLIENEKLELLREAEFKIEKFARLDDSVRLKKWTERRHQLEKEVHELQKRYHDFILNDQCQICLSTHDQPVLITCCQNAYCGKCLIQWLQHKSSCPHCRSFVTTEMILYLTQHNSNHESENECKEIEVKQSLDNKKKNKQTVILNIIESKPDGKFIIFSNYDETFCLIRHALYDDGISFAEISGSMECRQKKINSFKHGDLNVLFINSLANGAGLNLQEATDVILYHRMCENMEVQIIGRAYRIGRTRPLDVHHLV